MQQAAGFRDVSFPVRLYPVEYKHGKLRQEDEYSLQLRAQAMCLEEMYDTVIEEGAIFFITAHRRQPVRFDHPLRMKVLETLRQLESIRRSFDVPVAVPSARCARCSLKELCLPDLSRSAAGYCRAVEKGSHGGICPVRKLLETLYMLTPESDLFHRNENICIAIGGEEKASVPATQVDSIVLFGKNTFSASLIGFCGEKGISIVFFDANGRFQGRVCGPVSGNVLLRKRQYDRMNDGHFTRSVALSMLSGKLVNSKHVLMRHARNMKERDSARAERLLHAANALASHTALLSQCPDVDGMRGIEGAAAAYFACFDDMLA